MPCGPRSFLLALLALLAVALACASFSHEPQRLLAQAQEELKLRQYEAAYQHLATIRIDYPRREESREAFGPAARAFQGLYFRKRSDPTSEWVQTEPRFMLEWLETFFRGDVFPQAQVEALVRGMPRAFFDDDYQAYTATQPTMARWRVTVTDDNGLIDSISAEPARTRESAG